MRQNGRTMTLCPLPVSPIPSRRTVPVTQSRDLKPGVDGRRVPGHSAAATVCVACSGCSALMLVSLRIPQHGIRTRQMKPETIVRASVQVFRASSHERTAPRFERARSRPRELEPSLRWESWRRIISIENYPQALRLSGCGRMTTSVEFPRFKLLTASESEAVPGRVEPEDDQPFR
jgi:hypothetical protein